MDIERLCQKYCLDARSFAEKNVQKGKNPAKFSKFGGVRGTSRT